ncbi:MAG: hypothetical protein H0U27_02325 [Nitrosopumilus sp.]|nr:hypothetical protein [Nitrosopumilus sp.]
MNIIGNRDNSINTGDEVNKSGEEDLKKNNEKIGKNKDKFTKDYADKYITKNGKEFQTFINRLKVLFTKGKWIDNTRMQNRIVRQVGRLTSKLDKEVLNENEYIDIKNQVMNMKQVCETMKASNEKVKDVDLILQSLGKLDELIVKKAKENLPRQKSIKNEDLQPIHQNDQQISNVQSEKQIENLKQQIDEIQTKYEQMQTRYLEKNEELELVELLASLEIMNASVNDVVSIPADSTEHAYSEQLEKKLFALEDQLNSLEHNKNELEAKIEVLTDKLNTSHGELEINSKALAESQKDLRSAKSEIKSIYENIQTTYPEIVKNAQELEKAQKEITQLKLNTIDVAHASTEKKSHKLEMNKKTQDELDHLKNDIRGLKNKTLVPKEGTKLNPIEQGINRKIAVEIQRLNAEYDEKIVKAKNESADKLNSKGDIGSKLLFEEREENVAKIKILDAKVKELTTTQKQLLSKAPEQDKKIIQLNSALKRIKNNEATISELQNQIEKSSGIEEQLQEAKSSLKEVQADMIGNRNQIDELQGIIQGLEKTIKEKDSIIKEKDTVIMEKNNQIIENDAAIIKQKTKKAIYKEEKVELKQQLESLNKRLKNAEENFATAKEKFALTQNELGKKLGDANAVLIGGANTAVFEHGKAADIKNEVELIKYKTIFERVKSELEPESDKVSKRTAEVFRAKMDKNLTIAQAKIEHDKTLNIARDHAKALRAHLNDAFLVAKGQDSWLFKKLNNEEIQNLLEEKNFVMKDFNDAHKIIDNTQKVVNLLNKIFGSSINLDSFNKLWSEMEWIQEIRNKVSDAVPHNKVKVPEGFKTPNAEISKQDYEKKAEKNVKIAGQIGETLRIGVASQISGLIDAVFEDEVQGDFSFFTGNYSDELRGIQEGLNSSVQKQTANLLASAESAVQRLVIEEYARRKEPIPDAIVNRFNAITSDINKINEIEMKSNVEVYALEKTARKARKQEKIKEKLGIELNEMIDEALTMPNVGGSDDTKLLEIQEELKNVKNLTHESIYDLCNWAVFYIGDRIKQLPEAKHLQVYKLLGKIK